MEEGLATDDHIQPPTPQGSMEAGLATGDHIQPPTPQGSMEAGFAMWILTLPLDSGGGGRWGDDDGDNWDRLGSTATIGIDWDQYENELN